MAGSLLLLVCANGVSFFLKVIAVMGIRTAGRKDSYDDLLWQPSDLVMANVVNAYGRRNNCLKISRCEDDTPIYIFQDQQVRRVLSDERIANTRSSFEHWIVDEFNRLEACHDSKGEPLIEPSAMLPPWSSA